MVNTSIPVCGYEQPEYKLIYKYLAIEVVNYCHVPFPQYVGPVSSWYYLLRSTQGLRSNTRSQWFFWRQHLCPLGNICKCLEKFMVVITGEERCYRLGTVLSTPPYAGNHTSHTPRHDKEVSRTKCNNSSKAEKPALGQCYACQASYRQPCLSSWHRRFLYLAVCFVLSF